MIDPSTHDAGLGWSLSIDQADRYCVVKLKGEICASSAGPLRDKFDPVAASGPQEVIVDLSEVLHMECEVVDAFVELGGTLATQGRQLILSSARPLVLRMLLDQPAHDGLQIAYDPSSL